MWVGTSKRALVGRKNSASRFGALTRKALDREFSPSKTRLIRGFVRENCKNKNIQQEQPAFSVSIENDGCLRITSAHRIRRNILMLKNPPKKGNNEKKCGMIGTNWAFLLTIELRLLICQLSGGELKLQFDLMGAPSRRLARACERNHQGAHICLAESKNGKSRVDMGTTKDRACSIRAKSNIMLVIPRARILQYSLSEAS
jgi:hypothetical protein